MQLSVSSMAAKSTMSEDRLSTWDSREERNMRHIETHEEVGVPAGSRLSAQRLEEVRTLLFIGGDEIVSVFHK